MAILTKTEADRLKLTNPAKIFYHVGELFPRLFNEDESRKFYDGMPLEVKIIYIGEFTLESSFFSKIKCPLCGKEEALIPYFCGASVLSGCHVIKFHCLECKELIADNNNSEYFHKIRDFVIKNRTNFNKTGAKGLLQRKINNYVLFWHTGRLC